MLNFADDNGNMEASVRRIKMQVLPADDIDAAELISDLIAHGVLIEYSVNDKKYWHIKGFKKHQRINRPSLSSIPQPGLTDDSVNTHGVVSEGSGSGSGSGIKNTSSPKGDWPRFDEFWLAYPRKTDKAKALKAWNKIKPDDSLVNLILNAVRSQSRTDQWTRDDGQYIPHPTTWLNGKRWEDETPPPGGGPGSGQKGGGLPIHQAGARS